jgi:Protein of unknown function (DUF3108)
MIDRILIVLALLAALAQGRDAPSRPAAGQAALEPASDLAPLPGVAGGVTPDSPFAPGEELVFGVRSSRFGQIGEARMRVTGPDTVRGREAYVLSFDFSAKVLLFRVSDRTRSWFDPATASSLRYSKRERSPLSDRDEEVEIYPDEQRWVEDGVAGELVTPAPLDELSFLYYVRMLPLRAGDVYRLERHFDARRNPVTITVAGRESRREAVGTAIEGTYDLIVVDMQVPDGRQDEGTTRIRLYVTDDAAHVPVRLETGMPFGGTMVLELKARLVHAR